MLCCISDLVKAMLRKTTAACNQSALDRLHHLQELHKPQHCEAVAQHDLWTLAHSEPERIHTRMTNDVAMNHWFVCNHGTVTAHAGKPITYDPFINLLTVMEHQIPVETMEKLWEVPQAKDQGGDELKDFEQVWVRDAAKACHHVQNSSSIESRTPRPAALAQIECKSFEELIN